MELNISSCEISRSGVGCGYPEMIVIGVIYIFCAIYSGFLFIRYLKLRPKDSRKCFDIQIVFWTIMISWFLYKSIIKIVPFHFSWRSFYIFGVGLNHILFLGGISLVAIIVLDQLYNYQGIDSKNAKFFKFFFAIYLLVFLVTGISISIIDDSLQTRTGSIIDIWYACSSLLIALFVILPSNKLMKVVSYPVIQPGSVVCVRVSTIFLWTFGFLFLARCVLNVLSYSGIDPLLRMTNKSNGKLESGGRAFLFITNLLFDIIPAIQACWIVYMLFKHDLDFQNDNLYSPHY